MVHGADSNMPATLKYKQVLSVYPSVAKDAASVFTLGYWSAAQALAQPLLAIPAPAHRRSPRAPSSTPPVRGCARRPFGKIKLDGNRLAIFDNRVVRVTAPSGGSQVPGINTIERMPNVNQTFGGSSYAGEHGISIALEPLNRFENDMLNTTAQGLEFCTAVGLENVGLLLDTFHMNIEEKRIGLALREAGERLLHFHASESDRGAPGSGHVDWLEVRGVLAEIGYDDVVSVESFVPTVPGLQTAVSMWRPFFEDADSFARESLTHLHSVFEFKTEEA